jgi:DNA-binding transcriptional ArsR family regulator
MTEIKNTEFPEIEQADWESVEEYAGKLMDSSGMDREAATLEAIDAILNKKKAQDKKGPRFVKVGGAAITPVRWVVKNFLEAGALGMIFGDSGTYKSFLTVALSACIATGQDFYGMPVRRKGAVYYIAAEGQNGIIRRFRAWSQENKPVIDAPLYRYEGAVNLSVAADVLIKALDEAIKNEAEPPILAVIDTWSRSLGDDDSDTAAAAEGLAKVDQIRALFKDMAVLIIHHTGHANKDRARGASLLHAAVDSEYRLEVDKNRNIVMTNTKSKESELLPPLAFRARGVKLLAENGYILNEDGEIETSAVLEAVEYTPPVEGLGINQEKILQILRKTDDKKLNYDDLLEAFKLETGKRKTQFDQSLESLEDAGLLYYETGFICIGRQPETKNA